jgi:hypothetical protein
VGDLSRGEDGLAWLEGEALVAYLEEDFAFHDVKPFLLREMVVERWATGEEVGVLDHEEVAVGFLRGGLEGDA